MEDSNKSGQQESPKPNSMEGVLYSQADVDRFRAEILAAYEKDSQEIANIVLNQIPDGLKALIPEALSPVDKVKWYEKAKAAGLLAKPIIPETDDKKPKLNPPTANASELPPIARMSMGYNNASK